MNTFQCSKQDDVTTSTLKMIFVEIKPPKAKPYHVLSWYRPPSDTMEAFENLERVLRLLDSEDKEIILLGDTNWDLSNKRLESSSNNLPNIINRLADLYDTYILSGIFPTDMKIVKIVPVHKSGSFSSFVNYRPISVLPLLSKVIEKLVQRQLMEFLDKNKLLSKFHFGFRPRLSTELAATCLLDEIRKSVDQGKLVGAPFKDLSKAFDTISHCNLLQKLPRYGIKEGELS